MRDADLRPALVALEELERRRAELPAPPPPAAREWSTVSDVAQHLDTASEGAKGLLASAIVAGYVQEHLDWPGYYRLTRRGRAVLG